jgi:hypothetical protein
MKRDYLAYLTGFEKSNMGKKINEYTGKRALDFAESGRICCFTDQITILYDVFRCRQSVSTFDFENFDYYHHVSMI